MINFWMKTTLVNFGLDKEDFTETINIDFISRSILTYISQQYIYWYQALQINRGVPTASGHLS